MLSREDYIKYISDILAVLEVSIRNRGLLNLYDANVISEHFIQGLLNIVFDYDLENLNSVVQKNQVSIDLGDREKGIAFQVTSTKTSRKIQRTLDKFIENRLYEHYEQLRVFILREKQRSYKDFDTSGIFHFDKREHILDFRDLLAKINTLETNKLGEIQAFIGREVQMKTPQYNLDLSYDRSVLSEIRKALPTEGEVIYWVCSQDFFGSFAADWISALERALDHCRFEFTNDELEALRSKFVDATERFLKNIKVNTFPLDHRPDINRIPREWEFRNSEDYYRVGRELNDLANEVCEAHKCLIHTGRRKLGI